MRYLLFLVVYLSLHLPITSRAQCLVPSDMGDTLMPTIDRVKTLSPFAALPLYDWKRAVHKFAIHQNTMFVAGDFDYIGPNTGTGLVMDLASTTLSTQKKWRINGPVYASVPDGSGGYFIGGTFTRIGDTSVYNLAHINAAGEPYDWKPLVFGDVKGIAMKNDTLFIAGTFNSVNGQTRNGLALINKNTGTTLDPILANNFLASGTELHTLFLVDTILYVGGDITVNGFSCFKVNTRTGAFLAFPANLQMEEVYAFGVSENKGKIFIGGFGGNPFNIDGFCINPANNAILYSFSVWTQADPSDGEIHTIKSYGSNVYIGGIFNRGTVNGTPVTQNGLIVFDTANGQLRNYLANCDGIISSMNAYNGQVYIGGEFTSIGAVTRHNFAVFDTTTKLIVNGTPLVSDGARTFSFQGTEMFAGGVFQSWNCVRRKSMAAFDLTTGEIKNWQPTLSIIAVGDMKVQGDTVFVAGQFSPGGVLVAIDPVTAAVSPAPGLSGMGKELLFDNGYIYVAGATGSFGNNRLVKIGLPSLGQVSTWKPNPPFDVESVQKRGNTVYAVGGNCAVSVINDATGTLIQTYDLTNNIPGFYRVNNAVLAGSRLFIGGIFTQLRGTSRHNLAAVNVSDMSITPFRTESFRGSGGLWVQHYGDHLYVRGSFDSLNGKPHKYVAVMDTVVGAIFPDRLKLSTDGIYNYNLLDQINDPTHLTSLILSNDKLYIGGRFRNVSQKMFPSLAKLQMLPGPPPPTVLPVVNGPSTLNSPSNDNLFTITNANPEYRYMWLYTGMDIDIRKNGTDSARLDVGPLATPGVLKVVAMTECGKSDTTFFPISITAPEPTVSASGLSVLRITDTSATIKFTRGNGVRRIVVMKPLSTITDLPVDGTEYIADTSLGLGSNLGNNSYIIYKGSGDSVNVTDLANATSYYVSVIEFNGINGSANYLLSNIPEINFPTLAHRPTVQASAIVISDKTQTSLTISCTNGNGSGRLIVIRQASNGPTLPVNANGYTASTIFGSGSDLGANNYVVSTGTQPVNVTNLSPNTQYRITIFEYNGSVSSTNYLTAGYPSYTVRTIATEPTIPASNITVTSITNTSCTINCTPGNGEFRLVLMRQTDSITVVPQDSMYYGFGSSNVTFGTTTDLGGGTYVMNSATPVNVSGLAPNTVYHISIFEFNGFAWSNNYLINPLPTAYFATSVVTPTVPASGLTVSNITPTTARTNCVSGNGSKRLFVIRAGASVSDNPVNGMEYTANAAIGSGSNIGNNSFVIGHEQPIDISSLSPNTTYHIKVFEYNGVGAGTMYRIAGAPSISFTTPNTLAPEPTTATTSIITTNISANAVTINCTPGNGSARLVVIKAGTNITSQPTDGTGYIANTIFASGANIGDLTYVVSNTNTPVTVTGLSAFTEYTISVFEYNGSAGTANYLTNNIPIHSFQTLAPEPTSQASGISVSALTTSGATISCVNGNGNNRLIVIKMGTAITNVPIDGNSYMANAQFGSGVDIGNQTYVISNTTAPVSVTGLQPGTDYTVTVFEYNGTGTTANYLVVNNPVLTFRTLATQPTTPASNIQFSNISANGVSVNCTNGDGANRIVVIRAGSSVTSTPMDGTAYNASTVFGNGSNIGDQTFVVSLAAPVTISALTPNTEYSVAVFEYNGTGTSINYLTANFPSSAFRTLAPEPTTPTSNILITNVLPNSVTVAATIGDGVNRLVVIRQGSSLSGTPVDGTSYNANPAFGNGSDIGNQTFVVATGLPATVSGLQPNTDYTVSIFEYNGTGSTTNYLLQNNPVQTFRTAFPTGVIDLGIPGTFIKVYPNPVTGNRAYLAIETNKRGKCEVELFTIDGQKLLNQNFTIVSNNTVFTLQLPPDIAGQALIVKFTFNKKSGKALLIKAE